jgi:histidinol-phosphate aminotransferase
MGKHTRYLSGLAASLEPYVPGEQPRERRYIKLNTNESPFSPSPGVIIAVQAEAAQLRLYPDPAVTELRKALAKHHSLLPEQVFVGNGSDEVLAFAFQAFFAGAPLRSVDITYSFYPVFAQLFGVAYETSPVRADFSSDPETLLGDSGVVLANPNAPTSRAMPLEEIRRIAESCREHGRVLVVDEAYAAFGGESAVPLLATMDNLVVVRTFSKAHALAGMRVGYALGHAALIEGLERVKNCFNSYTVNRLAQAAALAALADTAYFERCVITLRATRKRCAARLAELGFEVMPSATNFLFARHPAHPGAELQASLRERGVLVRRFDTPRIGDWLRITIGTDEEMDKVLAIIEGLLNPRPDQPKPLRRRKSA